MCWLCSLLEYCLTSLGGHPNPLLFCPIVQQARGGVHVGVFGRFSSNECRLLIFERADIKALIGVMVSKATIKSVMKNRVDIKVVKLVASRSVGTFWMAVFISQSLRGSWIWFVFFKTLHNNFGLWIGTMDSYKFVAWGICKKRGHRAAMWFVIEDFIFILVVWGGLMWFVTGNQEPEIV